MYVIILSICKLGRVIKLVRILEQWEFPSEKAFSVTHLAQQNLPPHAVFSVAAGYISNQNTCPPFGDMYNYRYMYSETCYSVDT